LWDLADDEDSRLLIDAMYAAGKPVAAVCHGVAALRDARGPFGLPLVRGKAVTGFSDSEERAAGLAEVVPFLVEDMLKEAGGLYSKAADWQPHVVTSDNLITGQNPASSAGAAKAVLQQLRRPAQAA
jgi:putative intracellular protease/amidase